MTRAEALRVALIALGGAALAPLWLPALAWLVAVWAAVLGGLR